jgi:hypothetical protein
MTLPPHLDNDTVRRFDVVRLSLYRSHAMLFLNVMNAVPAGCLGSPAVTRGR